MQNTVPCPALPSVPCLDTLSMLSHRIYREKVYRLWLQEKQASISWVALHHVRDRDLFRLSPFTLLPGQGHD